eukprot:COSAG01_NODE_5864_length_3984_cov_44.260489_4_plen_53_part_00
MGRDELDPGPVLLLRRLQRPMIDISIDRSSDRPAHTCNHPPTPSSSRLRSPL